MIKKMVEDDVDCIIVAAGMEGALATLVSTLVDIPIIGNSHISRIWLW